MKLVVTGGTGFLGGHLLAALRDRGEDCVVASRRPERARRSLPEGTAACGLDVGSLTQACRGADAVVNLAGANVLGGRWTEAYKRTIRESRLSTTRAVVDALGALPDGERPQTLVSASAIGLYGDTGSATVDESGPAADDFLGEVCAAWEEAARGAEAHGVRVVLPRIGVVLGRGGGALARMLPPFRLGLGGPVGSGRQFVSWVHVDDVVAFVLLALDDAQLSGAYNLTAPEPVRMSRLSSALAAALRRPAFLRVPAFVLRVAFGEGAAPVLDSVRVVPRRTEEAGFRFRHRTIDGALGELVGR